MKKYQGSKLKKANYDLVQLRGGVVFTTGLVDSVRIIVFVYYGVFEIAFIENVSATTEILLASGFFM